MGVHIHKLSNLGGSSVLVQCTHTKLDSRHYKEPVIGNRKSQILFKKVTNVCKYYQTGTNAFSISLRKKETLAITVNSLTRIA